MKVNGGGAGVPFVLADVVDRQRGSRIIVDDGAGSGGLVQAAPLGLVRFTVKVSSGSTLVSPLTCTVMFWVVWPARNVRVPLVAR